MCLAAHKNLSSATSTGLNLFLLSGKKVRLGHTTQEKIQDVFSLFRNHRKSNLYKQITITTKQFQAAETIIETTKNPLRSLDAIHLGIASSNEFILFSFDRIMNQAAKEFNIPTIEI